MSQGRFWPRWQVSVATLLWLTLCVASFFGGGYWERVAKLQTNVAKAMAAAKPAVSHTYIQLPAGATTTVRSPMPVNRLLVADPSIATIVPDTSRSFIVTAKRAGATSITTWGESADQTVIYQVVSY